MDRVNFLRKKWFAGTITPTEMTEWFSDLKGAYNASDLNRVGAAMEYISQRLADAGYGHMLNLKQIGRQLTITVLAHLIIT